MIVDDFDMGRTLLGPIEAYAPLVVDPDRMLTAAVARQRFKPVRGRCPQVVKPAGAIEHVKLSQRLFSMALKRFTNSPIRAGKNRGRETTESSSSNIT
jgi:hypothetical protein